MTIQRRARPAQPARQVQPARPVQPQPPVPPERPAQPAPPVPPGHAVQPQPPVPPERPVRLGRPAARGGQARAAPPPRLRPPLTKRLRPAHWMTLDFLAAAVCALLLFFSLRQTVPGPPVFHGTGAGIWPWPTYGLPALLLAAALSLPVALRRRQPLIALGTAVIVASLGALAMPYPSALLLFLPVAYVLYLVAATSGRRVAVSALAAVLALVAAEGLAMRLTLPGRSVGNSVSVALVVIIIWVLGYAVGQQRAYTVQLRDQAATSAVTEERLRIARELHDVVAHSMTVIAVQAGFGRHVIDAQPARAAEALGAIQMTSREALAEMRRMLGVLRQAGPDAAGPDAAGAASTRMAGTTPAGTAPAATAWASTASAGTAPAGHPDAAGSAGHQAASGSAGAAPLMPAPGLADLDRLVARIGQAGVRTDLEVRGRRRDLPQGIDLSAFRIVQEALTNVVKHAAASCCRVVVTYGDEDLAVDVTDDGRGVQAQGQAGPGAAGPAEGHGLIGMRERVSLYGGELSAGPLPGRGFRVFARLPLGDGAP